LILHNANEVGRRNHGPGLKDNTQCERWQARESESKKEKENERGRNRKGKREREKELGRCSHEARPQS